MQLKRFMSVGGLALATGLLAIGDASACSICRCGDPTFNALGKEGVPQSGLRLALDVDRLEKSQGGDVPGDYEDIVEERVTLLGAYALTERVGLFARIPYSRRKLAETAGGDTERSSGSGLADPELYGQVRVWSSPFETDVGLRTSVFVVAGVKTSWGENNLQRDGARADEHLQPGTGSTDWFGGLAGSHQLNPKSALFASVQYRSTGRNEVGYRYGSIWLANVAYEHKLNDRFDTAMELNYRHAARDAVDFDGNIDDNTGGSMLFITPRLLFSIGGKWVLRGAVQIPLTQSGLNGVQHENAVFNVGITYLK